MDRCGLVADVGGTNVRFALVDLDRPRGVSLVAPQELVAKAHAGIAEAARSYLAGRKLAAPPAAAVLAVAGPVRDDAISLTNLNWSFSADGLRGALHIDRVHLINDFEAVAYCVPHLEASDLVAIGPVLPAPDPAKERETVAIVGPGTGLGVGGYVRSHDAMFALVTEGGHVAFAPTDDLEIEVLKFLRKRHRHVSAERILSGPGLANLHEAMAEIEGVGGDRLEAHQITARARMDADSFCAKVFARFCAILGSVCGDVALVMGAREGMLIAGGILPAMADIFAASAFRERFEAKGRFREYLREIPTRLIVQDYAGLMGAAAYLRREGAGPSHR